MKNPIHSLPILLVCLGLPLLAMSATPARADEKPVRSGETSAEAKPTAKDEAQAGQRLISIVLLLSEPRNLTHEEIAHAISEGTGDKVTEKDVITRNPYHLVTVGSEKFLVNNLAEPYFEDSAKLAAEIKDPALSQAVKDSKAWVSVDWVGRDSVTDLRPVYVQIGKMITHLSNAKAVAVYSPDMDEFALWSPATRKGLESADPLAVFDSATGAGKPAQ